MGRTVNTGQIFKSKESGKEKFTDYKWSRQPRWQPLKALYYSQQYAKQNTYNKRHVECLSSRSIRLENDNVQLMLQLLVVQKTINKVSLNHGNKTD